MLSLLMIRLFSRNWITNKQIYPRIVTDAVSTDNSPRYSADQPGNSPECHFGWFVYCLEHEQPADQHNNNSHRNPGMIHQDIQQINPGTVSDAVPAEESEFGELSPLLPFLSGESQLFLFQFSNQRFLSLSYSTWKYNSALRQSGCIFKPVTVARRTRRLGGMRF